MARGIIGKALAGAGAAVQPVALEGLRASILAERDARLQQYQTSERIAGQEFQQGERIATQEFQTAEKGKDRAITEKQVNATVRAADIAYQEGKLKVDSLKRVQALQDAFIKETDPAKKEQIADQIYTLAAKDKFTPVIGKDDLGNPVFMGAFDTRSGKLKTGAEGKPEVDATDPLGLRGGKQTPSAAGTPPALDEQKLREKLRQSDTPERKARRENIEATRTSAEDAIITKETPAPKKAEAPASKKKSDEQRLAELERILSEPQMSILEGGLIKQAREGRRFFGYAERKQLERERDMLRKKLGRE